MDSPAASGHSVNASSTPLTVNLLSFFTHGGSLFLQVETTAPPPRRSFRRKKKIPARFDTFQSNVVADARLMKNTLLIYNSLAPFFVPHAVLDPETWY
jgi:hypothetical protein